jgi:glyoxylase I family protein
MPAIEHFAIYASDLGRAKTFYETMLGMRVVLDNSSATVPGYFLRSESGSALEIIQRPLDTTIVNQRFVCHVAFLVDDFPAAKAALLARGVRFEAETEIRTDEIQTAFFSDPEGNRCQILWRKNPLPT